MADVKILHYHKQVRLEAGGIVRAVLDLCTGLAAAGHEATLATPDDSDVPAEWRAPSAGAPCAVRVPAPSLPGLVFTRRQLRDLEPLIEAAEVLHLHGMWGAYNAQLARVARRVGVPYVFSVHGMLDDWCMSQRRAKKRLFLALAGNRMLREAAAVHFTAEAELAQGRRWLPRENGVVIPLMLDVEPFRALPGSGPAQAALADHLDPDLPTVLYLSRLHYKKGVEHLIDAAAELRDRGRRVRVLVAGTGDEDYVRSLHARVERGQLTDVVRFPGFVSGVEKVSLYELADLFVLPTSQENFGFVLFEALAAGTPVVTTRGADTWPELEASGGGVISEADPPRLADAMAGILDDPARAQSMGESGRAWVLAHLDAAAVVDAFEALYARVAAR